jgi:hypothetical protein
MDPAVINIIVAFSNVVFGIAAIVRHAMYRQYGEMAIVQCCMVVSFLMHMSERKHGLPGIMPFCLLERQFLWIDRIVGCILGASLVLNNYDNAWFWSVGIFGLICMTISENTKRGPVWFAAWHCAWHASVFYILAYITVV